MASLLLVSGCLPAIAQFTEINAGFTQVAAGCALWGDHDNDGDLDVLITGFIVAHNTGSTTLYRNDGGGVFTSVATPFQQVGYSAGAWGDYDADGYLDVVISGMPTGTGDGATQLYHNNGNGTFSSVTALQGSWFGSECWGDYDHDGDQDLLQGGRTTLALYRNDGGGLNNSGTAFPNPGDLYGRAIWADFDNDGDLDIFAAGDSAFPARSRILRKESNGSFAIVAEFYHRFYNAAAWGDYDNDDDLDLAISGYDIGAGGFTKILRNDGSTNFAETAISLPGIYYSSLAWGDYDNDGDLDLVFGGASDTNNITRLYRNDGGASFTNVWTAPQELTDAVVSWADFDNDNDLDFVICGETNGVKVTKLFRNDAMAANTPPPPPGNLTVQKSGKSALLSWSPTTDAQQSGGLSYNVRLGTTSGGINRIAPNSNPLTGFRRVPELGNAGLRTNYFITNLNAGTYYWSVQAIDHAFAGSAFAAEGSFTISPPTITNQPQALTISAGQTAAFSVGASGNAPLSYQWRFNNVNIPGATNASFVLSNAQFVSQGWYSVAVSDIVGASFSTNVFLTVNSAPVITSQPLGQTIALGGGVSFSISAIGNAPFTYQWRFNGTNIAGATNVTLLVLDVQFTNAGNYSVLVSNALGGMLSSNALLNVYQAGQGVQTISAPGGGDMVYDGARDIIYIVNDGSVLRYHLGSNVFLTPFQPGTNSNFYAVDLSPDGNTLAVADHNGGSGYVWIYLIDLMTGTNRQVAFPAGWETGVYSLAYGNDGALLMVSDFTGGSAPVSLRRYDPGADTTTNLASVNERSLLTASGDGSVIGVGEGTVSSGRLFKYDVASRGITDFAQSEQFSWVSPGVNHNGTQFTISMDHATYVLDSNMNHFHTFGGAYLGPRPVGVVYHPSADLMFMAWGGSSQVIGYDTTTLTEFARYDFGTYFGTGAQTHYRTRLSRDGTLLMVNVGNAIKFLRWGSAPPQIASQPANISAGMTSNATFSVTALGTAPFNYQWFFQGGYLPGATEATLTLTNLQPTQEGGYYVVVSNPYGVATSSVATLTLTGPPVITNQPQSATVSAGANHLFTVGAVGTKPLSYEWRINGATILTSGFSSFTIGGAQDISAGDYTVVIANSLGSITSAVATLVVMPAAPLFTVQPQSQTNAAGEAVAFSAYAAGTQPIYYQWRLNGTNLSDQTDLSLSLLNVQAAHAGEYSVLASNSVGTTVSAVATLTVTPLIPTFTTQPVSRSAPKGAEVLFTTAVKGTEPFAYQWRLNEVNLHGATTASWLLTNIQTTDAGNYTVVITNAAGTATSSIATLTIAPPPGFLWARKGGGTSVDAGNCVTVDAAGNAYVAGYFNTTASFSGSNLTAFGSTDIYLAKYNPAGQLLWLRQAGGVGEDAAGAITTDAAGNVFLTGYFNLIANFNGLWVTNSNPIVGNRDIFVAKFDPDGNPAWVKGFGASSHDQGNGIALDASGNVFVTGQFYGTVAFGSTNLVSSGNNEVFLTKLDSSGNVLWARKAGGTSEDYGLSVAIDKSGNAVIAGYFHSLSAAFGNVTLTNTLQSVGVSDAFVAKYDGSGNLLWARKAGSVGNDQATAVLVDVLGNTLVTGSYNGNATFDTLMLTSVSSSTDVFLAKYDPFGNILWAKSAGGPGLDTGNALTLDAGGNTYVVGRFNGLAIFGTTNLSSSGGDDVFVTAYSSAGNVLWARKAGGSGTDIGLGVAGDSHFNLFVTGTFISGNAAFGHLPLATTGVSDGFLTKLVTVDASAPPVLTVQPSNQVAQAGANVVLSADFAGVPPLAFQWRFNGANLAGATNVMLILSNAITAQAGNYSLVLSNSNGAITSQVITVTITVEPDFLWTRAGGSLANDEVLSVAADASGNTYAAGYFSGSMTLGTSNFVSSGGEDIFLAKWDSETNLVWARQAGGPGNDRATGLAVIGPDELVMAGSFEDTADFSGTRRTSSGGSDVFVSKYDSSSGDLAWVQRAGGAGDDAALALAVRSVPAEICLAGSFQGSATFGGLTLNSGGSNDVFVAKYTSGGNVMWAKRSGNSGDDRARGVTMDSAGNVYVAGSYNGTLFFGQNMLTNGGGLDGFIAKYDAGGTEQWGRRLGTLGGGTAASTFNDEAQATVADRDGNIFVAGYFHNRAVIGSNTFTSASTNLPDAFLTKFDSNGNALWSKQAGGVGADYATALSTDFGGNAYLAGAFNNAALFSPVSTTSVGGADVFVAMYDATGRLIKLRRAGGVGEDSARSVIADGRGNAVIGGTHGAPAVFGGFAAENAGDRDAFVTTVAFFNPNSAPVITSQPIGASATNGQNVALSVGVSSGTPLRFQWFFNGGAPAGATNGNLLLSNLQYAGVGPYFVTVSNAFGVVTSATAIVRIEQTPEVVWTVRHGGTGDDQGLAVAVDFAANVYVAGLFSGTVAFGTSNLVSGGGTDIFLAKYNSLGSLLWAKRFGGLSADLPQCLAVDKAGNVFMAGTFASSTVSFGATTVTNKSSPIAVFSDVFLVKFDGNGNSLWAGSASGSQNDQATSIAVDDAGGAYLTGSYHNAAIFGNVGLTNLNNTNFFLAKYNPAGNVLWARTAMGVNTSQGNGVCVDAATNVYVTGYLFGSVNFGSGVITNTNSAAGGFGNGTVFVAKYDVNGVLQWAKKGGTNGLGYGQNIVADASGNVFATSYRRDYGGGVMLTKYDGAGTVIWVRTNAISCCTGDYISVNGLALDAAGNPVLAGGMTGSGPLEGTNFFSPQQGFIVKYRSVDSTPFWIFKSGQMGYAAALDGNGNAYIAGRFSGTTLFGTSSNLVSSGGNDAFLVKFGARAPAITAQPTHRLVIAGSNTTLQVTTTGAPATYQWQFNGANIAGATNSSYALNSFNSGKAGRYSVVVQSASGWTTSSVAGVGLIPVLSVAAASNSAVLNWDGVFTLQSSPEVLGPYADSFTGAGPLTNGFALDDFQRYFRLRVPSPDVTGVLQSETFALNFLGSPGRRYAIQSSTNLVNWTTIATDVFPFAVTDASVAPKKFYRALLIP